MFSSCNSLVCETPIVIAQTSKIYSKVLFILDYFIYSNKPIMFVSDVNKTKIKDHIYQKVLFIIYLIYKYFSLHGKIGL